MSVNLSLIHISILKANHPYYINAGVYFNDQKTLEFYQKSLPLLEKYTELLKARNADESEIKSALLKLRNVYYNLSLLGVDKSKELQEVETELNINQ